MIGVDVGSEVVKWFDGKRFGTGFPKGRGIVAGLSSKELLVRRTLYPLCRGSQLRKLITNDVSSDVGVSPEELAVAFCQVEKKKEGCEFIVFVEKKEALERLESSVGELSVITADIVGVTTAAKLLFGEKSLTVIDAGASKTSVIELSGGKLNAVEVIRAGFKALKNSPSLLKERVIPAVKSKEVLLVGGGALDGEFVELLKGELKVEVPEEEPFGKETPLYFGAFGLYHFRKSPCRASFRELSLLSSEFFKKNRGKLLTSLFAAFSGLLFLTAAEYASYLKEKKDYITLKREYKRAVERILGEKVVAPEEQLYQALQKLEREKELLLIDKPSVLLYLDGISKSVVKGIRVLKLTGSSTADSFQLSGLAENTEALKSFTKNLKKHFKRVNTDLSKETTKGVKFTITVMGVRSD